MSRRGTLDIDTRLDNNLEEHTKPRGSAVSTWSLSGQGSGHTSLDGSVHERLHQHAPARETPTTAGYSTDVLVAAMASMASRMASTARQNAASLNSLASS